MIEHIAIAGAGISGMSAALTLSNRGYRVTVYAAAFSPLITSNKAAAFWFPYHIRNDKRGIDWCNASYRFYKDYCNDATTGISMHRLIKVLRKGVVEEEPIWITFMPEGACRLLPENELPDGVAKIYSVDVPLIETQLFLPWLQRRLEQQGVSFVERKINALDELTATHDLVINCTGLGAASLCNDKELVPVRGQVGLITPGPSLPIYLDNEKPLYIVPRKDAIIVGGTYEEGIDSTITEPDTVERILGNAYQVYPELKDQPVIGSWAGVRPYRPTVRVEREPGKNIIHNYGHGGSGFTLAFGCAETVGVLTDEMNKDH